ncbi:hypothetical protein [Streptomyces sp. NPDC088725]|uniref:hypothetical protein n=1 Tax=Streptomyces sp. NPDC088725 TaxID=3365873 RepID=UPI00381F1814
MADDTADTTRPRLLLNAEPFGFGPSAASAILAAELAPFCGTLGYVGGGHTLDLQCGPPYHAVHDTTGLSESEQQTLLTQLSPQYDLFVTAMDFEAGDRAQRAGLSVAVYDALTWFWSAIPAVARDAALYIAQDFFGVRERIAADPALRRNSVIVPPIIPPPRVWRPGKHVLVNLGGLHSPFWQPSEAAAYARLMAAAVRAAQPVGRSVVVTASRSIAAALGDPAVGTHDHGTVLDLMSNAAYACMTPGLGNIYDAATTGVPTLWLPSTNDSQYAQARLLREHGYCDAHVDWTDLGRPVDYSAPLPTAMEAVNRAVRELSTQRPLRERLVGRLAKSTAELGLFPGRAQSLTDRFGHSGIRQAAAALLRWAAQNPGRPRH